MAAWLDGRVEVIIMLSQLLDIAVVETEAELGKIKTTSKLKTNSKMKMSKKMSKTSPVDSYSKMDPKSKIFSAVSTGNRI